MKLQSPFEVITPTADGDVLTALVRRGDWMSVAQVVDLVGSRSDEGVRRVIHRLVEQGIVDVLPVGKRSMFRLNRHHLLASAIESIAHARATLLARVTERLAAWASPPRYAALFGSAARNTMAAKSDLDLLLVHPSEVDELWDSNVADLMVDVRSWTGNDLRVIHYAEQDVVSEDPLLAELVNDAIPVLGDHSWFRKKIGHT
ncbi:MAG: nucleotidyltransferase domain-containing protein [Microcella sp.]